MHKVIGSVLVKNEDRFVEQSIRNIADFCDKIIISDNGSNDGTWSILQELDAVYDHMTLSKIDDTVQSQELLRPYAGGDYWVFGVDGDEIYDPVGLMRFKKRLLSGELDKSWVVFGNALNCVHVDEKEGVARGYLAPPSRSMTKLYNFSAISDWTGCGHRLSGGSPVFKEGFDASMRNELYKSVTWEDADFRCLHTCFTGRTSLAAGKHQDGEARLNITETQGRTPWLRLKDWMLGAMGLRRGSPWKMEKYCRGDLVEKDVSMFFKSDRHQ